MTQVGFSEACERNKVPILESLLPELSGASKVVEIGSGTGQHVVHFARATPAIRWQPADTGDYLLALRARLTSEAPANVAPPVELDVRMPSWPLGKFDAVFSANTLHYMGSTTSQRSLSMIMRVTDTATGQTLAGPVAQTIRYTALNADENLRIAVKQLTNLTLSVCNVPESSLVRESELKLMTRAGPEIGVASTKAFTTQLYALLMLVVALGKRRGLAADKINQSKRPEIPETDKYRLGKYL